MSWSVNEPLQTSEGKAKAGDIHRPLGPHTLALIIAVRVRPASRPLGSTLRAGLSLDELFASHEA